MRLGIPVIVLMIFMPGCADSDKMPPLPASHPASVDAPETPYSTEASVLAADRSIPPSSTTAPAASPDKHGSTHQQHRPEAGQ